MADRSNEVLKQVLEKIELPEGAYEMADKRYTDIGEWLHREESSCVAFNPLVFPQGSFRLGTAIRPEKSESFDLDMGCSLRQGLTKDNVTQEQLKKIVGDELERYREARNIQKEMAEKQRCWRLEYADRLSFHMDIVPCIPASVSKKIELKERMIDLSALDEAVASNVSALALSITDNTDPGYQAIVDHWRISNPEGYAVWFESRMKLASQFLAEREMMIKDSIDNLPYYAWKTPLQISIQLLKRHRDTMFKDNEDAKPISVIITTLAARAYEGESDLVFALSNILNTMGQHIQDNLPRIANPVNPLEDFADKWYSADHKHLELEANFQKWLFQAKADFASICSKDNSRTILEAAKHGFSVDLDKTSVEFALGLSATVAAPSQRIEVNDPKPWSKI